MRSIAERENREGASVARCWPAIRMAWDFRWGRASRKSWETRMAAAPPSEVGQHCKRVRGSWIMGDLDTCSRVYTCWNWE